MASTRYDVCLVFAVAVVPFASVAWSMSPIRLNAPLNQLGDVSPTSLQLSPDGNAVLFLADQDLNGMNEAFVVPIGGGEVTKVNAQLPIGASVTGADFSPDGERIVYRANQDDLQHIELYSTTIGGSPVKLNRTLPEFGNVGTTQFTTNEIVIYVADQDTSSVQEVYAVSISGGDPVKVSGPMAIGGDAQIVASDPVNGTVIYVADQEVDLRTELYGASIDGNSYWKLNGPLQTLNSDVNVKSVRLTPDGAHVIYVADANVDEAYGLFSVPSTGGDPVPLTPQMANAGDVLPNPIQISPLGDRVLYLADQLVDEVLEIFTIPVTGGQSTRVNGALVMGGDVREESLQFSADGSKVLYIADQLTNEVYELFVAPSTGGESLRLNSPLVSSGDVAAAAFSSDGERVVYLADQQANEIFELFSVSTSGGEAVRLNEPLTSSRDVSDFEITPDGQHVVYWADQDVDEQFELYLAPIAGGNIQKLNGDLPIGGDVRDWLISPDGQYVVYRADQNVDEQYELFSVSLWDQTPGDYNNDGVVDAADYTVWRDGLGTEYDMDDYGVWKDGFGGGSAGGTAATLSVPEPSSAAFWASLLISAVVRINRANPAPRGAKGRILPSHS